MSSKTKRKHDQDKDDDEGTTDEEMRLERIHGRSVENERAFPVYSSNPVIQEFFERHGKKYVSRNAWLVFKDGARIQLTWDGYGRQEEPPDDKLELAKRRHDYFEQKCRLAERAFRDYREAILGRGDTLVCIAEGTEEEQVEKLEELKTLALFARKQLQKAAKVVQDETPCWMSAAKRQEARNKRRREEHRQKIKDIKI